MLLNKLLEDIEVLENEETGNPDISLVCADSRKAVPGCMFVCLEGGATRGRRGRCGISGCFKKAGWLQRTSFDLYKLYKRSFCTALQ